MKQTSKDKTNNEYMTESTKTVVIFDKVARKYCKNSHISPLSSNDALIVSSDGNSATFIEFKNGRIDNKTQYELLKKNYDSILILTDIVNQNISTTKQY